MCFLWGQAVGLPLYESTMKGNAMKSFILNAMNVQNGHTKMFKVRGENVDHAIQRLESDEYITADAPYGWEVLACDMCFAAKMRDY